MSKKQRAQEALDKSRGPFNCTPLDNVMQAIIDALPEEPEVIHLSGHSSPNFWGGPEPVEVKESQPASALIEMCKKLLIALYETGAHQKYYELQHEFNAILGKGVPPAAQSQAQRPQDIEEQRIDKEIAEVKEEATKVSTCEPCNRFFIDECPTCGKKPGFSYLSEERQLRTALGVARAEGQIMEREYARVTKLLGRCEDVLGECAHFICGVGREDVAKRIHVFLESVMPGAMVKKGPIL